MKSGAQKCVTQRVRNSAGSVTSRTFSPPAPKKSRVWSRAIKIMIAPRNRSIESMRGRTATTKRDTGWSTAARRGIGDPFKSSNGGPMSWLSRGCADCLPRSNGAYSSRLCRGLTVRLARSLLQKGVQPPLDLFVTQDDCDQQAPPPHRYAGQRLRMQGNDRSNKVRHGEPLRFRGLRNRAVRYRTMSKSAERVTAVTRPARCIRCPMNGHARLTAHVSDWTQRDRPRRARRAHRPP